MSDAPKKRLVEARRDGFNGRLHRRTAARRYGRSIQTACYGFSILADHPGRRRAFHEHAKNREGRCRRSDHLGDPQAALPALGPLRRSRATRYFMYQGIFDTDFDKYTEDAVALFGATRHRTRSSRTSRAFPKDWKTNPPAFVKFVRDHQSPELPGVRRVSRTSSADEIKKALKLKAAFFENARPDAVTGERSHARARRHPAHSARPARPRSRDGTSSCPFEAPPAGRAWLSAILDKVQSAAPGAGFGREGQALGDRGFHLERLAGARRGRDLALDVSGRVQAGHGGPGGGARATPARTTPTSWLGGLASPDLHAIVILFARDAAERERCQAEHEAARRAVRGVEVLSSLDLGGDAAVRLRPRPLRLSRPALAAGHRRHAARSRRPAPARR